MKKEAFLPLFAIGLSMSASACSNAPEVPQQVVSAHEYVLNEYNCDVNAATIEIADLSEASLEAFGSANIGLAATDAESITLDNDLSASQMASLVIHESFHWCADRGNLFYVTTPIIIPGIGALTSIDGFVPYIDRDETVGNTFVEEGVVEWLSRIEAGYTRHHNYEVIALVTEEIAQIRNIDPRVIVELLKTDNLLGFVGLIKNKPTQEVTGQDIADIFNLYMNSHQTNAVPSQQIIQSALDS